MNLKNAKKLGKFLGELVDEKVLSMRVCRFIRVRVIIDVTPKLKVGCMINRDDNSQSWVQFKYERMLEFCYKCEKIDHMEKACQVKTKILKGLLIIEWDLGNG